MIDDWAMNDDDTADIGELTGSLQFVLGPSGRRPSSHGTVVVSQRLW